MKRGIFLAAVLGLAVLVSLAHAGTPQAKLDGVWIPETATVNGEKLGMDKIAKIKVTIKGTKYTMQKGDKVLSKGTFTLDNAKNPKWMDVVSETDGKKLKINGIYKLDGDTLTVCGSTEGKERPTDFTSTEGSDRELVVYRRQK